MTRVEIALTERTDQMSLLARIAPHIGGFQETTGTEALGLLLSDDDAARALTTALRVGFPELPEPLRFVTQSASGETRPDAVGLHNDREVVHVEGKFWAGLTVAQADNLYLKRLLNEHDVRDPQHPCRGVLLWVCPPRRATTLWDEVLGVSGGVEGGISTSAKWRYGRTSNHQGIALVDWHALCETLEHAGSTHLAEDVRQLHGFVTAVDANAFLPWTFEQISDQEGARRQHELAKLALDIRGAGQQAGVLPRVGRNSSANFASSGGPVIYPGGLWTAFLVSSPLQAEYGMSPWWLRWFKSGAPVAREALRKYGLVETEDGCAVPVPLRPGALRDEVMGETLEWLAEVGDLLDRVKTDREARGLAGNETDEVPELHDEVEIEVTQMDP